MSMPANLDPADVVKTYQAVVTERDDLETPPKIRRELDRTAYRLRKLWAKWRGEDSLDEMAFGEPPNQPGPVDSGLLNMQLAFRQEFPADK